MMGYMVYSILKPQFIERAVSEYKGIDFWAREEIKAEKNISVGLQLLSPDFHIDTLYASMIGPKSSHHFNIDKSSEDFVWLTGYAVEIVNKQDSIGEQGKFMCHNNLNCNIKKYYNQLGLPERSKKVNGRLITLSQGQTSLEFPAGFGLPIPSNHLLSMDGQVLNQSNKKPDFHIQHKVNLSYTKSDDPSFDAIKPLFTKNLSVLVQTSNMRTDEDVLLCLPAQSTSEFNSKNQEGDSFSGHWIIEPGSSEYKYNVTEMLNLPFSTTVHFAGAHLHPFAESLELRDLTLDVTLITLYAINSTNEAELTKIDVLSSEEGIELEKDHQYELVCSVNNTTDVNQEMMAVMLLYMYDEEFDGLVKDE